MLGRQVDPLPPTISVDGSVAGGVNVPPPLARQAWRWSGVASARWPSRSLNSLSSPHLGAGAGPGGPGGNCEPDARRTDDQAPRGAGHSRRRRGRTQSRVLCPACSDRADDRRRRGGPGSPADPIPLAEPPARARRLGVGASPHGCLERGVCRGTGLRHAEAPAPRPLGEVPPLVPAVDVLGIDPGRSRLPASNGHVNHARIPLATIALVRSNPDSSGGLVPSPPVAPARRHRSSALTPTTSLVATT